MLKLRKKKWNVMMVGDGINATIISGNQNFMDGWTTFRLATFDLFAGLVWNVVGYVAEIRVLLEDGGLLGIGWGVAECLHWSVGVWLLEYSHWKRALLLEVKLKVLLLEYFH
ncbi:hypothetical protein AB3S75_031358 [Citrus x aurantiifolia]